MGPGRVGGLIGVSLVMGPGRVGGLIGVSLVMGPGRVGGVNRGFTSDGAW